VATSAAKALAALQRERPDVLLSDIGMPEEDGYMLIQRVRALPDAMKLVLQPEAPLIFSWLPQPC
jgi:CheY-like chemotaxis protein